MATIYTPDEYLGSILNPGSSPGQDRRGVQTGLTYVGGRAQVSYELPLNEVVFDFYDRLKSISRGYASFDYEQIGLRPGDLVKMNILVNNEPVDALSMIVHRTQAEPRGRALVSAALRMERVKGDRSSRMYDRAGSGVEQARKSLPMTAHVEHATT
jgi:GTP-binding protein LepA